MLGTVEYYHYDGGYGRGARGVMREFNVWEVEGFIAERWREGDHCEYFGGDGR